MRDRERVTERERMRDRERMRERERRGEKRQRMRDLKWKRLIDREKISSNVVCSQQNQWRPFQC